MNLMKEELVPFLQATRPDLATALTFERLTFVRRIIDLQKVIRNWEWVEYHGCITGDCPHTDSCDCWPSIVELLEEISKEARAALGETE